MLDLPSWLTPNYEQLLSQYTSNKLPHGILLLGHPGDGAALLSSALIGRLLCTESGNMACGQCKSCMLHQHSHHPDYLKVEPEGKSLTIKIDSIRAISKLVSGTAQQAGNKVIYIQSAEKMNNNAANALLKVLEEPTNKTFLVLESGELSRLLPTIRSRCRLYRLELPTTEQSQSVFLSRDENIENFRAKMAMSNGRPFDALKFTDENVRDWYERESKFIQTTSFIDLSKHIAADSVESVLSQVLLWVDSSIKRKNNVDLVDNAVSSNLLSNLAQLSAVSLFAFRDYIVEALAAQNRQANLNKQLVAEQLASRWLEMRGVI